MYMYAWTVNKIPYSAKFLSDKNSTCVHCICIMVGNLFVNFKFYFITYNNWKQVYLAENFSSLATPDEIDEYIA